MVHSSEVLLVTGGSRGIGAAVVRAAVREGYAVCFSYLESLAAATQLVEELTAQDGRVCAVAGDVADPRFAAKFFDAAGSVLGPATALVNNAGITGKIGPFADLPRDLLRRTLDVNLVGTMLTSQEAVRRWDAANVLGRIVNVSSVAAALGSPNEYVHYAASKAAVEAFTVGLGKELAGKGVRVNAVAAGTAYTDIHAAGGDPDRPARVVSRVPLGRIAQPEEIAASILWLLSAQSSYVTATVLRVAGGL